VLNVIAVVLVIIGNAIPSWSHESFPIPFLNKFGAESCHWGPWKLVGGVLVATLAADPQRVTVVTRLDLRSFPRRVCICCERVVGLC
jgi:hypothetical protein